MKKLILTLAITAGVLSFAGANLRAQDQAPAPTTTGTDGGGQCSGGHASPGDHGPGDGQQGGHKGGHKHQAPAPAPAE